MGTHTRIEELVAFLISINARDITESFTIAELHDVVRGTDEGMESLKIALKDGAKEIMNQSFNEESLTLVNLVVNAFDEVWNEMHPDEERMNERGI